jgi:integrase/recombinase XerD
MTVDKETPEKGLLAPIEGPEGRALEASRGQAGRRTASEAFADYFGAVISNKNTRSAYLSDVRQFASWCAQEELKLEEVQTLDVARYRDALRARSCSAATIKRKLSAIRRLLSYMVESGALPYNPAREVATERLRTKSGKTPALDALQMRQLFESFDTQKLIQLRDRAIVSTMAYSLARVSAVTELTVQDFRDLGRTQYIRLHEKGGVERDIPAHPRLVEHIDAWLAASGISGSHVLYPAFEKRGTVLTDRPLDRNDVLRMVKRRLKRARMSKLFSCHSFRATGITEFLANGGSLETAQELANHADSRTTRLYDRRASRMELEEIVRIRF